MLTLKIALLIPCLYFLNEINGQEIEIGDIRINLVRSETILKSDQDPEMIYFGDCKCTKDRRPACGINLRSKGKGTSELCTIANTLL